MKLLSPVIGAIVFACLWGCTSTPSAPAVAPMSSAAIERQAQLDLESIREHYLGAFPDAEVPVVERIRFIVTEDWATVMAECLTEAGFPTTTDGEGLSSTPPTGQEQSWALAAYTCSAQYPIDPHQTRPLTEDQIGYIYDYLTQVAVPCMNDHGFDGVTTAPSRQTFIDSYATPEGWSPFWDAAIGASTDTWQQIHDACPQDPPGLFG